MPPCAIPGTSVALSPCFHSGSENEKTIIRRENISFFWRGSGGTFFFRKKRPPQEKTSSTKKTLLHVCADLVVVWGGNFFGGFFDFLLFGQVCGKRNFAFIAVAEEVLGLVGVEAFEGEGTQFAGGVEVGLFRDGLVGGLGVVVVEQGQEADGFQAAFVEFEDVGDVVGFFGFESDGGADLVVGPVVLHLGDVFDLFPDGDVGFGAVEVFLFDGEVDNPCVVAVDGFFDTVTGLAQGFDEGAGAVDADGAPVVLGVGVVDAGGDAGEQGDGAAGFDAGFFDAFGYAEPLGVDLVELFDVAVAFVAPAEVFATSDALEVFSDTRLTEADASVCAA